MRSQSMPPGPPHKPFLMGGADNRQQQGAARGGQEQATRWLLGRIKDDSQRSLLLQQTPHIALSLAASPPENPLHRTSLATGGTGASHPWRGPRPSASPGGPQAPPNHFKGAKPLDRAGSAHLRSNFISQISSGSSSRTWGATKVAAFPGSRISNDAKVPCQAPLAKTGIGPAQQCNSAFEKPQAVPPGSQAQFPSNPKKQHQLPQQQRPAATEEPRRANSCRKDTRLVLRTPLPLHWQEQQEQQEQQQQKAQQQHQRQRHLGQPQQPQQQPQQQTREPEGQLQQCQQGRQRQSHPHQQQPKQQQTLQHQYQQQLPQQRQHQQLYQKHSQHPYQQHQVQCQQKQLHPRQHQDAELSHMPAAAGYGSGDQQQQQKIPSNIQSARYNSAPPKLAAASSNRSTSNEGGSLFDTDNKEILSSTANALGTSWSVTKHPRSLSAKTPLPVSNIQRNPQGSLAHVASVHQKECQKAGSTASHDHFTADDQQQERPQQQRLQQLQQLQQQQQQYTEQQQHYHCDQQQEPRQQHMNHQHGQRQQQQQQAQHARIPCSSHQQLPLPAAHFTAPLPASAVIHHPSLPFHGALFGFLSPTQREVVEAPPDCSVCVLAGPGAGKTATLTARIVRLLLENCRPLAALTFTKKGAAELERRIRGSLASASLGIAATTSCPGSQLAQPQASQLADDDLFVGTFHAFFMKLLREHGAMLGVPSSFKVLGQLQQLAILRSLLEREKRAAATQGLSSLSAALTRSSTEDPPVSSDNGDLSEDEREANGQRNTTRNLWGDGASLSASGREAEELWRRIRSMKFVPELLQRERAAGSVLFRLFGEYTRHLRQQQPPLLDFADLTVMALRLLERPEAREALRARWPYVVVDEFQDTNSNQLRFLCLLVLQTLPKSDSSNPPPASSVGSLAAPLASSCTSCSVPCPALSLCEKTREDQRQRGGITVVGDDDQSIYKWRGTHTGIFHAFRRTFPNYREFVLGCNYRSVPPVVRHSLSLVSFNWPFRISKALHSVHDASVRDRSEATTPQCHRGDVRGAFLPSPSLEAQYVLRYILCLKQQQGLRWDDFAILCRTNSALLDLQQLLADPRIQRGACATSFPLAALASHGGAGDTPQLPAEVKDPNAPIDPVHLFPTADAPALELPPGGLPLSNTASRRAREGVEMFQRPDALDLLCYLRLAVDPHHDASLVRVLNRPPRRVGAKTVLALRRLQRVSVSSGCTSSSEEPLLRGGGTEMPWEELPTDGMRGCKGNRDNKERVSLFDAINSVLSASGVDAEQADLSFAPDTAAGAAAAAAAARLRPAQLDSLNAVCSSIAKLRAASRTALSVPQMLEFVLGPLGLGVFIAERRILRRGRANVVTSGERVDNEEQGDGQAAEIQTATTEVDVLGKTRGGGKRGRRVWKAGCAALHTEEPNGPKKSVTDSCKSQSPVPFDGSQALQELSQKYGSEAFADVLGLIRAAEAYAPNWQQRTAAECIWCLLRDAGSGRFVQQKAHNAITLSTIHQAKGLEWKAVIVARANDGTLPMGLGGSQPLADLVARTLSSFAEGPPTQEALGRAEAAILRQAAGNDQHLHLMEERRVCYVALTRAKQFLLLTAPLADKSNHPLKPSRFFQEAGLVKQRLALPQAAPNKRKTGEIFPEEPPLKSQQITAYAEDAA